MDEDEKELDLALYEEALEQEQRELEVSAMRIHRLKTLDVYFDLSRSGVKPYEIRQNDRLYQRGDTVELYCIRKNFSGIPEIKTATGVYVPWPLDSFTKQPLKLDMFETDFRNSLERLTGVIEFVLPGNESIGMFEDHVILSIKHLDYKGPNFLANTYGNQPSMFDIITGPGYEAGFANDPANQIKPEPAVQVAIPAGIYYVRELEGFFDEIDGVGKGNYFNESYRYERHRFPIKSLADHKAIVEDRKGINRKKIIERYKKYSTDIPIASSNDIPEGVYWSPTSNDFINETTKTSMGKDFNTEYYLRRYHFPQQVPASDEVTSHTNEKYQEDTPVEDRKAIPGDVYWSPEKAMFYDSNTNKVMGDGFYIEWVDRSHEFPTEVLKPKYTKDGKLKA